MFTEIPGKNVDRTSFYSNHDLETIAMFFIRWTNNKKGHHGIFPKQRPAIDANIRRTESAFNC